jgi:hypothetical protein
MVIAHKNGNTNGFLLIIADLGLLKEGLARTVELRLDWLPPSQMLS